MITSRTIPIPRRGAVRASTGALPVAVRVSALSFTDLSQRLQDDWTREVRTAARAEGHQEAVRGACALLEEAAEQLDRARERAEDALASDAVHLGVEIARQLLKIEIAAENYDLESIVRSTLAASEIKRGHCIVNLHPDDAQSLSGVPFRGETELVANVDVPRGTVHVETPRGLLVRDSEAALDEICEQLLEDLA